MNAKFLITLAFTLASVFFYVENFQAQRLVSGGKPKESSVGGFDSGYCVNLSSKFRVCKAANYERGETKFLISKNNKILTTTDAPYYSLACCEMKDFFALRGDLDKDGSAEIIIASLEGIGNGMGIASYKIHIFRDPTKFASEKPLIFSLQEFGEKGNFIFDKQKNETQILVTYWSSFENLDPNRGYGTYLVGKWFRYRNGLLEPVFEKPTLARRFLYSFGDEVRKTQNNLFTPYLWLKIRKSHRFFAEPKENSKLVKTEHGAIKIYEQDDEIYQRRLFIQTDSGRSLKGVYTFNSFGDKKEEENTVYITDIGLLKLKYTFPFEFNPSTYFEQIEGKRVRLETYLDKYNNKYTKLWLVENAGTK